MSRKSTHEDRIWRKTVITRDKECVVKACRSTNHLQAHHIHDYSHYPELRHDLDNGTTLCSKCHIAFHTMYKKSFRCSCNMDDFINFMDLTNYVYEKTQN